MSLSPTIQARVDTWYANAESFLQTAQTDYIATHARYLQGLKSHTIIPKPRANSSGDTVPDNLQTKPSDREEGFFDFIPGLNGQKWPVAITVHEYEGPQGLGYMVLLEALDDNDVVCSRLIDYGPENRSTNWT